MKILLISDIHGNLSAMNACFETFNRLGADGCVILGDIIDYGPHSNETIEFLSQIDIPIICSIRGNHEQAIINDDYSRFSSERGKLCAKNTKAALNDKTMDYILNKMNFNGLEEFFVGSKLCLAVHGSIDDPFWGKLSAEKPLTEYSKYDFVFSGHSHIPHFFEKYYACDDAERRNKKKTIFINPGSIGQPRNLCPFAQFAYADTETEEIRFYKIPYDIAFEQSCFSEETDAFYRTRLELGV